MKPFISENFILSNKTAERLYHTYAENKPVIDFHCHLSPAMIAEDRIFSNFTQAWLEGDHYKWRAMRTNGVNEEYCTGKASDESKFMKWAETVPYTAGNPLYHWTHLELARYFGINELLSPRNANTVYEQASAMLRSENFSVKNLLRKAHVQVVCTTDDPADNLEYHRKMQGSFEIKILPTFRPDNLLKTEDPEKFKLYIEKLGNAENTEIKDFNTLLSVTDKRHEFFHKNGCRLSDHGIGDFFYNDSTPVEIEQVFRNLIAGRAITPDDSEKFRTAMFIELCRMNHSRGWTQQFHAGPLRNNNARLFRLIGPDTGFDSIGMPLDAAKLSQFLSALDNTDQLAKTILYNINPADNEMMITMAGNFNDGSIPMKVQYGAAWWFLDQKNGMEKHLRDLSSFSLLSRFIGMVTDSRSFLSYPRHEYFRRILCNYIGSEVEKGLIPDDDGLLAPVIEGVSYNNARDYFGF
jgi:glucuronate isomerase